MLAVIGRGAADAAPGRRSLAGWTGRTAGRVSGRGLQQGIFDRSGERISEIAT
jgi:hypothetical protein